jgi:hypothetical protein
MKLLLSVIPLVFAVQLLHAAPVHMKLGNYQGVDAYGQECTVFLGTGLGGTYLSFMWFRNSQGSYNTRTGSDPQPRAGKIEGANTLMADGYDQGLPYFRSFSGAPIGTYLIDIGYTMHVSGDTLKSLKFTSSPFLYYGKALCKNMTWTGPKRPH